MSDAELRGPSLEQIEGLLDALTPKEKRDLMVVRDGFEEKDRVERLLRNLFVKAILTRSSDVHIGGHQDGESLKVVINVRTPGGMENQTYTGSAGQHFHAKLFNLTGTPLGGTVADAIATRFAMRLPAHLVRRYGMATRGDEPYDVVVRVQYIKTYDGFAFGCRLLDQQRAPKLDELGLSYALLSTIRRAIEVPSGLILVSGPTGSGKTTILNAILGELNDGQRSIITNENPVEFNLRGDGPIKQIQIGGEITFARALRANLRLDPDVILVGEIRDTETMETALQAAQTGHLVLATIHANSGAETFSRALDLTVDKERDAFRIADVTKLVMAQRLLDRYQGEPQLRCLTRDEERWLGYNGIDTPTEILETVPTRLNGKVAIVEAIATTDEIKMIMRSGKFGVADVYRAARNQLQYESLIAGGMRAVETKGCVLRDCMRSLDSNTDARTHPGLRSTLAKEHGITLGAVATAIDAYCAARDAGHDGGRNVGRGVVLEDFLAQQRSDLCAEEL